MISLPTLTKNLFQMQQTQEVLTEYDFLTHSDWKLIFQVITSEGLNGI